MGHTQCEGKPEKLQDILGDKETHSRLLSGQVYELEKTAGLECVCVGGQNGWRFGPLAEWNYRSVNQSMME